MIIGRNYENYGQIIAQSFIDILDNFANTNAPKQVDASYGLTHRKSFKSHNATEGIRHVLPLSVGGVPAGEMPNNGLRPNNCKLFVNDGLDTKN